jgi:D-sedoheptulose 7-phosphate isomerase
MFESSIEMYVSNINDALLKVSQVDIDDALAALSLVLNTNKTIWIAGNGGSAATASHFATDLSRCFNIDSNPVRGVSLCDNTSLITAIGNDFGFEFIFSKQLSNLAIKGDLLVTLSASGNSKNLLSAMNWAKANGISNLALTGFDGGQAKLITDFSLHIPTAIGDYGVVEDAHSILCHYLSSQFRTVR